MKLRYVLAGDLIIKEGDAGDEMYIIDSGEFIVQKRDENGVNQTVFTYTTPGAAFGELSLMYGKPRAASVRSKTDGKIWSIGRQAFRSVLMTRKDGNILKTLRHIPLLSDLSVPKLQRLSETILEETYNSNEKINISQDSSKGKWTVLVVLHGSVKITYKNGTKAVEVRNEGGCIGEKEAKLFEAVKSEGKAKIIRISESAYVEIVGKKVEEAEGVISDSNIKASKSSLGKLSRQQSIWSQPGKEFKQKENKADYQYVNSIINLNDIAYVCTFNKTRNKNSYSIKLICKQKSEENKSCVQFMKERNFLSVLSDVSTSIANVLSTFQDDKFAYMVYDDYFTCDLSTLIAMNDLSEQDKVVYCASIYTSISCIHDKGLLHRFINTTSFYISSHSNLPILCDFRYAKKMDGSKAYTICGDPLYFAPEIVGQAGYTYSVDLWSFGLIIFDLFEVSIYHCYIKLPWSSSVF